MSTQTMTAALALRVPERFTYTDRGLQRASDWVRYEVHPGTYPISFTDSRWNEIPGNTRDEAEALAREKAASYSYPVDLTAFLPYYAVAKVTATKVASYYENSLFGAVSGHDETHDELTTITWRPYAYEVKPGLRAYCEWTGTPGVDYRLVHHAEVVTLDAAGGQA